MNHVFEQPGQINETLFQIQLCVLIWHETGKKVLRWFGFYPNIQIYSCGSQRKGAKSQQLLPYGLRTRISLGWSHSQ